MNGFELYQHILDNTLHDLKGTWEVTQDNELKVTGSNVNGSYVVFPDVLTNFRLEWEMTVLASTGTVRINSGISPILLTDPTGSSVEGWNNGTITNAKFVYFMCNWNGSGDGNVGTLKSISDNGSMSNVNSSTGSFTVGTKYTYKLVRADGYLRLYQDNNLISEYQETTYADTPFYLGWYMWWGGTYPDYQANFIIDNYVVTNLSTDTTKYLNDIGLSEVWTNTKNYISAQLLGKSNTGHTHTKSEITDFPTIPTKTSDLTNDSGFITDVSWNDVSNKPTFSTVATSGSYNDLTDKPTIPDVSNYYTKAEVDALISNASISPSTNTLFIGEPYSLANYAETNLGNYEEVSND